MVQGSVADADDDKFGCSCDHISSMDSEEDAKNGDNIVDEEDDDFESELNGRKYYLDGLLDDIVGDDVIAETNSGKLLGKRRNGVPEAG